MQSLISLYGSSPATPVKVDGVMPLTLAVTGCCALLLFALVGRFYLILTPLVFMVALRVIRGQRARAVSGEVAARARADLARALGHSLVYADFGAVASARRRGVVASGLAYDGSYLYAIEESVAERVPWSRVRRFRWEIAADPVTEVRVAVNVPGAMHVPDLSANVAQATRQAAAMQRSGFFLHVADVERPVRQFVTNDKAVLQRWFEILTQMKEGNLKVG